MLADLRTSLEHVLFDAGGIDSQDIDIKFWGPRKEWIDSLTRPTINLFLFDIQENTEKRETNMQTSRSNGTAERRLPPRRIDLRYMVSVLTTEIEDEHELLWRVLATLMKYQQLPPEVLPESLRSVEPPITTRIGEKEESGRLLEIWNALGTPPHPALCYIVTAPLDLDVAIQAPLVLTRTARYVRTVASGRAEVETDTHIGGVVRDKNGERLAGVTIKLENSGSGDDCTTDQNGQFVLRGVPQGPITLSVKKGGEIQKRVEVGVPSESYDIVLEV